MNHTYPAVEGLIAHCDSRILTLSLDRVNKKNAFTQTMYSALFEALQYAATDPQVSVVVIQGHTSIFSAGNDIADFQNNRTTEHERPVFQLLKQLASFPKPILAAVCGPAVGIGTTMLLHCDLVYAGENAAFSLPFVNLGVCPEAASSLLLPKLLGHQRASEALLLGEPFSAQTALQVGLINRILPTAEVHDFTQAQAAKLAAKPLASVLVTKRLLKQDSQAAVLARIDEEAAIFGEMLNAPAAQEAFAAFMEKRKPDFSKLPTNPASAA